MAFISRQSSLNDALWVSGWGGGVMQIESKYLSKSGSCLPVSVVVCAAILVLKPSTKVPGGELNLRESNTLQIPEPKPTETGSIQRSPPPVSTLARVFLKYVHIWIP